MWLVQQWRRWRRAWQAAGIAVLTVPVFVVAGSGLTGGGFPSVPPQPWPHLSSDIAPDPAVRYGALPNGMRYALMRNQMPAGAVSIRLSLAFGSLQEAENEKGLAHFIEHMAFNGSKNVPEGEMVKTLERLGMAFGADANASTNQKFTTYMMDLPGATEASIDKSLGLMREVASELAFDVGAVDRERGVVLSEWRRGDTFQRTRAEWQTDFLIPGAYAARRPPIGETEVIETATREMLVSLYRRYYRPERATLVLVGDVDLDAMERAISAHFADWHGAGEPGKDASQPYMLERREPAAAVFVHPDGGDSISVFSPATFVKRTDTASLREENLLAAIGIAIANRRLQQLSRTEGAAFRGAGLSWSSLLDAADMAHGVVVVRPGEWKDGLLAFEAEWRRALDSGFTKEEIDGVLSSISTAAGNAATTEHSRPTPGLATSLLATIQNDTVFTSPSADLVRFDAWKRAVTPQRVATAFNKRMSISSPLIFMSSTVPLPGIEEDLLKVWREGETAEIKSSTPVQKARFAYYDFGPAGRVTADRVDHDTGARFVTFENNVRLNFKRTDFQKKTVLVSVRVGDGAVALESAPFGLGRLMAAYTEGGLAKHSFSGLEEILAGHNVQAGFSIGPNSFGGVYATSDEDLALQLQLAAAYMRYPGYRPEAEARWREAIVLGWPHLDADARTAFASTAVRALAGGDRRFGSSANDGVVDRTFMELKSYLDPMFRDASIEIAIVGDVDEAAAIDSVAGTFGAFPRRRQDPRAARSASPVHFARGEFVFTHRGEADQALFKAHWPVDLQPGGDSQERRRLSMLAAIVRQKLIETLRERLGISYAPSSGFSYSDVYPGLNYIFIDVEAAPDQLGQIREAIDDIIAGLRGGELNPDDLDRVRAPALEQLSQHAISNAYWLSMLAQAQSDPDKLGSLSLISIGEGLRSIKVADILRDADKWLTAENMRTVVVLPAALMAGQVN